MTAPTKSTLDAATIAELNDLLQLDHDAVQAYTLAIGALKNVGRRETLMRFRGDHERHVAELTRLVRRYGGTPVDAPHATTGPFKLAIQTLGTLGGDREIIVAYKTNERESRDRYSRAANNATYPADVRAMIEAAAGDEVRHYEWAESQLETLGIAPDSATARVAGAVERVNARFAESVERAGTQGRRGLEIARRGVSAARERLPARPSGRALAVGVAAAAVGLAFTAVLRSALKRR